MEWATCYLTSNPLCGILFHVPLNHQVFKGTFWYSLLFQLQIWAGRIGEMSVPHMLMTISYCCCRGCFQRSACRLPIFVWCFVLQSKRLTGVVSGSITNGPRFDDGQTLITIREINLDISCADHAVLIKVGLYEVLSCVWGGARNDQKGIVPVPSTDR